MRIFNNCLFFLLFTSCLATIAHAAPTTEKARKIHFAVLQQPANGTDAPLEQEIVRATQKNIAFLVVNGIKSNEEPCSDSLYLRRKNLLSKAEKGVVLSLAGSDWIACRSEEGASLAVERLQRVRELFFDNGSELDAKKLNLVRQSLTPKFRSFSENAYWQQGKVIFATINMPADNNHYLAAAGRNNEFEDRLIANRHWLQRIFSLARQHKMRGVVVFTDGDLFAPPHRINATKRDGFVEMRKQLAQLTARFPGRVLIVHGHAPSRARQIVWHDNLGTIGAGMSLLEITADPGSYQVFSLPHANTRKK